jgi:hypothetical protein
MSTSRLMINQDGFLVRTAKDSEGGRGTKGKIIVKQDWFLGTPKLDIHIRSLPERYWGKHLRIMIVEADEVIKQELI